MKIISSISIPAIKILKNQTGSIFSIGNFAVLFLISLTLINMVNGHKKTNKMEYRSRSYLCVRFLNITTIRYIERIETINELIKLASLAKFSPYLPSNVAAKVVLETAKAYQEAHHAVSYMKNIISNRFCPSLSAASYITTLPYKMTAKVFLFERSINQTTILRKTKWKIKTGILEKEILAQDHFLIESSFSINEKKKIELFIKEKKILDLLNWKQHFGSASSYLSLFSI